MILKKVKSIRRERQIRRSVLSRPIVVSRMRTAMRMGLCIVLCMGLCIADDGLKGQATIYPEAAIPYYKADDIYDHIINRLDVQADTFYNVHTAIRKYSPQDLKLLNGKGHIQERVPSTQKGLFRTFYKNPTALYSVKTKDFELVINPILDLKIGYENAESKTVFLNKRGVEIYGHLDDRFYFYSSYEETQSNFVNYIDNYIQSYQAIRGKGNYKDYKSKVFGSIEGYDYGLATGYLGYKLSKHTALEIGHSKHFIGHGIRSLLLSDSGHNYFNVRFDVRFWKLHYQTIFAELSTISARYNRGNRLLPKKYMANHYLSFKPRHNIELGFFETVIFSRENNFELQYLNPVIFYRTIEHQLDSPDNVLIGLNGKWNIFQKTSLYGQLILDEFKVDELFGGQNWWANKYGIQLGLKYIDLLGIRHLDAQVEYNRVRPYTYSHWQQNSTFPEITVPNYSHFNQPLAHPLGANFTEFLLNLRYQPHPNISLEAQYLYTKVGSNSTTNTTPTEEVLNFGQDILIPNGTRVSNYGNTQNQGLLSTIQALDLVASYRITHKLYWDLHFQIRTDSNILRDLNTQYISTGIRYNVGVKRVDY